MLKRNLFSALWEGSHGVVGNCIRLQMEEGVL